MKKAARPAQGHLFGRLGSGPKQPRQHHHQGCDRLELAAKIGVGPLSNRRADLAHAFRSLIGTNHLVDQAQCINQPRDRNGQDNQERDLLQRCDKKGRS